ncbi:serine/threonine protein kinase [Photobacterium lipolyticum]|uniref:Serine/threonine protein kinase n=1 Tax=Photobacterium lipolyticum TaxID=266810 RepID=A0A2T3N2W0_9GAMM|nr:serine/threonine-protein kinase [Photobacterium lipolyticum]PSW06717.1 serine/threonine protein kinase [Photobacterium lipolyticum]
MNTDFSIGTTELFYDLLDLTEQEQQIYLNELKSTSPSKYHQIIQLFRADKQSLHREQSWLNLFSHSANELVNETPIHQLCDQQIGKYRLTHPLGQGGMGVVYAGIRNDGTFEQAVAIKFLQPSLFPFSGKELIYREAQMLARLNHPYIAKVYDGGIHQDLYSYIVMEKVDGIDLQKYLAQHPLPLKQRVQLLIDICQAVHHAHQFQVIHADLKPENILIDVNIKPKLLDFNLGQRVKNSPDDQQNIVAFSRLFASPEQLEGEYLTSQSDIYSLGKLAEWLLLKNEKSPAADLALIIQRATQDQAEKRYSSAQALADDLRNILCKQPIEMRSHQKSYVAKRFLQRHPVSSCLAGISLCAVILFIHLLTKANQQLITEKAVAEDMVYEMTSLLYHGKGPENNALSMERMLELTRRRVLSNPDLPVELKQKMLLAMMTPQSQAKHN